MGKVIEVRTRPPTDRILTAAEIGQHVCTSVETFLAQRPHGNAKNWDDLKDRLLRWVQRLDAQAAFLGLVWVLENEGRYQYQLVAGELLGRASIPCTLPPEELLRRVLPRFEESASTIPRYLAAALGIEAVTGCLRYLLASTDSPALRGKINTMRWWLKRKRRGATGMKYFTLDWWMGDSDVDPVLPYAAYVASVLHLLPLDLAALHKQNPLHDVRLRELRMDTATRELVLMLDAADGNGTFGRRLHLVYEGVTRFETVSDSTGVEWTAWLR